jgi:signal transduction histidine kinase
MLNKPIKSAQEKIWFFGFLRRRLASTLILVFVVLALLPITILVLSSLSQIENQGEQQAYRQLQAVADTKVQQLNDWLNGKDDSLFLLLANPENSQNMIALLSRPQNSLPPTDSLNYIFESNIGQRLGFTELFIYDLQGKIILSSKPVQVGKIVVNEPYFQPSLANEGIHPPFYDIGTGDLNMVITEPIKNETGTTIGLLAGRLDLNNLSNIILTRSGLGETGETYLVSVENNYLLTTSRFEANLNQAYHSEGIDAVLSGQNGFGNYTSYLGNIVFGTYRWLPQLKIGLVAEISQDEADVNVHQLSTNSLNTGIAAGGVAILFGTILAFWLTQPIMTLTRVATAIAAGDYSQKVNISLDNEIGQLANAFNMMTQKLLQTIEELKQSIQEVDEAKELSRAKDTFLATMSHELRTPLNSIIGFTGLLAMTGGLDPQKMHIVQRVRANSERLLTLINDILEISRIQAGRLELASEQVLIYDLIERLRSQMSILAEDKGLDFNITLDDNVPKVMTSDHEALTKIVTNLTSNAIKFTQQGSISVKVQYLNESLVIEVTDTGIGIPPHLHEVIFESFRQADQSTKRAYGGSGLGLAIVRELCLHMGGSVRISSTVSVGSTFTVTLPLEEKLKQLQE